MKLTLFAYYFKKIRGVFELFLMISVDLMLKPTKLDYISAVSQLGDRLKLVL